MKRNRRRRLLSLASVLLALAMVGTACGGESGNGDQGGGGGSNQLTIGYIAWDENIALAHLYKAVLEDNYGYTVKLQQLDVAPTWQALAQGDVDLFQDAWLPVTHEQYWKQHKDNVEDLGVWYDQATLNLAVPAYVNQVNSMADLKTNADLFNGTITGIEPGAGETAVIQDKVIPQYQLEGAMTLRNSSTTAMLAALDAAIKKKEPIVVALWHPHWAYSRYELKDLKDPKKAMGGAEKLHQLGREGFSQDYPELAKQIKSFKISDEQLGALEDAIQQGGQGNELQSAKDWAAKNKEYIDEMFGGLQAKQ